MIFQENKLCSASVPLTVSKHNSENRCSFQGDLKWASMSPTYPSNQKYQVFVDAPFFEVCNVLKNILTIKKEWQGTWNILASFCKPECKRSKEELAKAQNPLRCLRERDSKESVISTSAESDLQDNKWKAIVSPRLWNEN